MERKTNEIYMWIAANPSHTHAEIADGVGLKKTPYTHNMLTWLLREGYIAREWDQERYPQAYIYYCQATVPMDLQ